MLNALQRLQAERKVAVLIFAVLAALSFLRFHFIDPAEQAFSAGIGHDGNTVVRKAAPTIEVGL